MIYENSIAGQVDERAAFETWFEEWRRSTWRPLPSDIADGRAECPKHWNTNARRNMEIAWQARASLTPTAPQAASQQAEVPAHYRKVLAMPDGPDVVGPPLKVCRVCGSDIGALHALNCTHGTSTVVEKDCRAPQAATTAVCQPSTLTGQPDAAICQPAATTASASSLSKAQIDDIVYQCRQSGNDTTYDIVNAAIRAALARAPLPANDEKPVARLHEYVSDRPFSEGKKFFEITILDRARCFDGIELYAAPVQAVDVARDAARYRVLRLHVMPGDVRLAMTQLPPKAQTPPDRIDLLCDIEISRTNTSGGA